MPEAPIPSAIPRTHYASSDGASIAYQRFGEGPDLVFIAGSGTNLEVQWEHPVVAGFLRSLGSFARVTMLDKRGVGLSERFGDAPPPLHTRAEDLRAVMEAAGIDRATILGSSEGAPLAALVAAAHPELVERLILHATFAIHPLDSDGPWLDRIERGWGTGAVFDYLSDTFVQSVEDRRYLARLERQASTPRAARLLLEMSIETDLTGVLPTLDVPTLVLHRAGDSVFPVSSAETVADLIPGAELEILDGTDHWLFGGDSGPLLDRIERFMGGTPVSSPSPERALATVLFTDIVDSTRLAGSLGDQKWTARLDEFVAIASEVVGRAGGEVVAETGDGFVATFSSPGRAVEAGLALRSSVAPLGIQLRTGVHTAEIERRGDNIAGIGVHVASRVSDKAPAGQVWVSRTVRDLMAGTALTLSDRGEFELKGLEEPWVLYAVEA